MSQYESTMARAEERRAAKKVAFHSQYSPGRKRSCPPFCRIRAVENYGAGWARFGTTPISRITPDIGSTMIWGEIFSAEQKVTRDGSRKIYSINITDYTGSITLKILQNINECKALDSLSKGTSVIVRGDVEYGQIRP